MHPAAKSGEELAKELRYEATRSTGPGGQHRNRVATAIRVYHLPSGLTAMGTERRSQLENKVEALFRLRRKLALQLRSPIDDDLLAASTLYQPPEAWMRRLRKGRISVNPTHEDFPALLATVLDRLAADQDDLDRTAAAFRVSKSQLIKFLGLETAALGGLNDRRQERGQRPLRGH